ncbi:metal transporter [Ureibacillus massiliensis 4400831 = CIP 108448 = CCUG 49529]|uniref:Magnesium transport protein CorA n=1 Tax=Ureibacillus massiliensis 4400831 = CIP 108448 = CCUG 49529 TaxID=1211035 RepID=A0A0A3JXL4_9BACL|nr:magnesium/cobalt transporter CorA [Ureibacillus massiliensis]KGR91742.1 metal transporter [Ureibacillus massiliensis 4400831 = CIP 108448 = CCUG 49529]
MINFIGITNEDHLEKNTFTTNIDLMSFKWYWVDFSEPTEDEIKLLSDTFHFHPLAIEDCVQEFQRSKLDYYREYTFFVTHTVHEEENDIIKDEVDFFISEKYIVTFHKNPSIEVNKVWSMLLAQERLEKWDPYYVFYEVLDKIVDNYFPIVYKIEDELESMIKRTENKSMNQLMDELFETRNMLLNLLHIVNPMRDLLYRMLNSHHLNLNRIEERKEYFNDIYDHLLKLSEMVMTNREVTADIRDSYLSLNSHQTNNVMKMLTIITSIFAPLTFIAGIYGMNFENIPELTWEYGYFLSLGLMGFIGVAMLLWFWRRGWFK